MPKQPKKPQPRADLPSDRQDVGRYERLGRSIGKVCDLKNAEYGDSFNTCGDALRLQYPNGISPDQYDDMLNFARNWDKWSRICSGSDGSDVCEHCGRGESPYHDIVGYGLLGMARHGRAK